MGCSENTGACIRHVRLHGDVELSRDQEFQLRRGRAHHCEQRSDRYAPRGDHPRKGPTAGRFFRGQVDKYTWVDVGSSYVLSDMLAAFLYAQLERREEIQKNPAAPLESSIISSLKDWAASW